MTDSWERLTSTTLTERVYKALRDRILAGKVASGEFIREQEVSEGLGVSRTPVRESLGAPGSRRNRPTHSSSRPLDRVPLPPR